MVDAEEVLVRRAPRLALRQGQLQVAAEEGLLWKGSIEDLDRLRVLAPEESEVMLELLLQSKEILGRGGGRFEIICRGSRRRARLQSMENTLAARDDLAKGRFNSLLEALEDSDLVQKTVLSVRGADASLARSQDVELERTSSSHAGQALREVLHLRHNAVVDCRPSRNATIKHLVLRLRKRGAQGGEGRLVRIDGTFELGRRGRRVGVEKKCSCEHFEEGGERVERAVEVGLELRCGALRPNEEAHQVRDDGSDERDQEDALDRLCLKFAEKSAFLRDAEGESVSCDGMKGVRKLTWASKRGRPTNKRSRRSVWPKRLWHTQGSRTRNRSKEQGPGRVQV